MATYGGNSYQDPKNINLRGGTRGTGLIRFSQPPFKADGTNGNWATNPFSSTEVGIYVSSTGRLVFSYLGTVYNLNNNRTSGTPTIAMTTQNGITAAALATNSNDSAGVITTTGTSTGGTVIAVTFSAAYSVAPVVTLAPANAAGAAPNTQPFVSARSTTGFSITIPSGGTYAATPSYQYDVTDLGN